MIDLPLFASREMPAHQSRQIRRDTGAAQVWLGGLPAGSVAVSTSEDAADALTPTRLDKRRRLVLAWFQSRGERGGTADECVAAFGDGHQVNSFAPRVTELLALRQLERTTERRRTRAGAWAFVCRVRA
jgi:hypothetical protein